MQGIASDTAENGWNPSAAAWIALQGEDGDWARAFVLDPFILEFIRKRVPRRVLDVGCGEGRFCRLLKRNGFETVGVDPTIALIQEARRRDPLGEFYVQEAEKLEFRDGQFQFVVSYLTLTDIADFQSAIKEMARVLEVGGIMLVVNLSSFMTAAARPNELIKDSNGFDCYLPFDRYLEEFWRWTSLGDVRIKNWHRPLSAYMRAFLENDLKLRGFYEPRPSGGDVEKAALYCRAPWFVVMEWIK